MRKIVCFLFLLMSFNQVINANVKLEESSTTKSYDNILKAYEDSLIKLINFYDFEWNYSGEDLLKNPYYYKLFFQTTLYSAPIEQAMHDIWKKNDSIKYWSFPNSIYEDRGNNLNKTINDALVHIYAKYPTLVTIAENEIENENSIRKDLVIKKIETSDKLSSRTEDIKVPILNIDKLKPVVHKPNFWKYSGNYSLQFMQRHVSDNWYKAGESSNSLLANLICTANYNNKQKISFENKLEMRLGFITSKDDTVHQYKSNSDLIRLTNKLGFRATKHWYYTFLLQSWTQFYPGYKSNQEKVFSDFMSPFESLFSIGLDYKLNNNKINLSAYVSPLALKFKYVDRKALATSFGIDEGNHSKYEFGSNITVSSTWKVLKDVQWRSRLYCFTDYEKVQIEWENTIDFVLNKYLSTKLFLYPRFDDGRKRKEGESYIQFNEYFSLGFNYNF